MDHDIRSYCQAAGLALKARHEGRSFRTLAPQVRQMAEMLTLRELRELADLGLVSGRAPV